MQKNAASEFDRNRNQNWGPFSSPMMWGVFATVGWYLLIPYITFRQELLQRYFCGHPLAYAETGMFFVGAFILLFKACSLWGERKANRLAKHECQSSENSDDEKFEKVVVTAKNYPRTHIARRIADIRKERGDRKKTRHLQETLNYLAEIAAERVHAGFGFVRTITWAIPILGFLGTVIGITIAIGNLNFQDYESSMKNVVGGLSIAFDTTALALTLSVILVFGLYRIERSQQQILDEVEDFCRIDILPLISDGDKASPEYEDIPQHLSQELFRQTEHMIHRQAELWEDSLETMRNRWKESLSQREELFESGLEAGFSQTLENHSSQLGELRQELHRGLQESQSVIASSQKDFVLHLSLVSEQLRESLGSLQTHEQEKQERFLEAFSHRMREWNTSIAGVSAGMIDQAEELRDVCEKLASLSEHEGQLNRLEQKLNDNLGAIRESQTFEQTLQTLSAAVNLLTTRVGRNAA